MDERPDHPKGLSPTERARVAEVFVDHRQFVENVARQYAPGPQDVPDIVQAVGVQVCRSLAGFRGQCQLRTWLFRVTVNTARKHYHKERTEFRRPVEEMTTYGPSELVESDQDAHVQTGERLAALRAAVERLKPFYRQLIREELTGDGVLTHRKSSRHRARQRLKALLAEDPRLGNP